MKFSTQEMSVKIKNLEDQVLLTEQTKNELREKLRIADDGNREMIAFIKNLQQQGDIELSSMRNFLQNKISEDQSLNNKHNEKNSVLFNEMVRLGQENEKYAQRVSNMQATFESKMQQMEARLISAEQSNVLFDRKGESNSSILGDMLEKMEQRVLSLDQQVVSLKTEHSKERESINQLEFINLRNNEDFKNLVMGI